MRWQEVPGQSGGPWGQGEVQCGEMESTRGLGPAVSPKRDPRTCGTPSPELRPLFWDALRPEPGGRAAHVHRGFEELVRLGL